MIERFKKISDSTICCISAMFLIMIFITAPAMAAGMKNINVSNGSTQSKVTVTFDGVPVYAFFSLENPNRVVMDIRQSGVMKGLPLNFNGQNLVKRVRSSTPEDAQNQRLVFDMTQKVKTRAVTQKNGNSYTVVFTLDALDKAPPRAVSRAEATPRVATSINQEKSNPFNGKKLTAATREPTSTNQPVARSTPSPSRAASRKSDNSSNRITVAIDAGHGGQDPGAIGGNGLREKNVTIAIARKLEAKLRSDPMFNPVLTRNGDYFISVMGRSDVARKQGANILVSIHADAAPNRSASGASVWVLSNRRANSEMGNWLEQHEKQSELLGGAGDMLANTASDPYLSQAVLDLQFGHSQRVGYDVASKVLRELRQVGSLHKAVPEHASLGVLRSPDIPSLLVETGFISNTTEERLLGSSAYQDKVAHAIYAGLRSYFLAHPLQSVPKVENRPVLASARAVGKTRGKAISTSAAQTHQVKRGDTLSAIAEKYGVSMANIKTANRMVSGEVQLGQTLIIPHS